MNRMVKLVLLGVGGAVVILMQSGFLFILLALMPSIMAYIVDTDSKKLSFKVVFAGNVSAAMPTMMPMMKAMFGSHKFDVAAAMMDAKIWLFIYLGAGAGWALIYLCKFISRFVVTMKFEYNIKSLEHIQQMLVEEWGHEISLKMESEESE